MSFSDSSQSRDALSVLVLRSQKDAGLFPRAVEETRRLLYWLPLRLRILTRYSLAGFLLSCENRIPDYIRRYNGMIPYEAYIACIVRRRAPGWFHDQWRRQRRELSAEVMVSREAQPAYLYTNGVEHPAGRGSVPAEDIPLLFAKLLVPRQSRIDTRGNPTLAYLAARLGARKAARRGFLLMLSVIPDRVLAWRPSPVAALLGVSDALLADYFSGLDRAMRKKRIRQREAEDRLSYYHARSSFFTYYLGNGEPSSEEEKAACEESLRISRIGVLRARRTVKDLTPHLSHSEIGAMLGLTRNQVGGAIVTGRNLVLKALDAGKANR